MRFQLLGGLAVFDDGGEPVPVVGPSRRGLLAVLLLHAGEVLTADRLIDELWGQRAPPTAAKSLQVHVWRLRRALDGGGGNGPLATEAGGYVIQRRAGAARSGGVRGVVGAGRAALADGHAEAASVALTEALALWHGQALAEFADQPFAREATARLQELRLEAIEARIDADLLLGRHRVVIAELESLIAANPLRERLRAQLMLALYRCGRQADALAVYRETRTLLDDELGLEPGEELRALERAVLAHDPHLDLRSDHRDATIPRLGRTAGGQDRPPEPGSRSRGRPAVTADRRVRRAGLLVAAGAALALVAIAAIAVGLSGGSRSHIEAAPNSVAVIDERSDNVVETASVGVRPTGIAFGFGSVWVANADDQTLSRVDPTTLRQIRNVPVGGTPTGIAASRGAIWVTESDPSASSVSVKRIDPDFNSPGRAVRIGNVDPGGPAAIAARGNDGLGRPVLRAADAA